MASLEKVNRTDTQWRERSTRLDKIKNFYTEA